MAVILNERALRHAESLIRNGDFTDDDRDLWSEHQPSAEQENRFIEAHGYEGYGKWYLGIDEDKSADTKGRYEFPYGDFQQVHRCGLLAAEVRAGQCEHFDIERAAAHLQGMLDMAKREAA